MDANRQPDSLTRLAEEAAELAACFERGRPTKRQKLMTRLRSFRVAFAAAFTGTKQAGQDAAERLQTVATALDRNGGNDLALLTAFEASKTQCGAWVRDADGLVEAADTVSASLTSVVSSLRDDGGAAVEFGRTFIAQTVMNLRTLASRAIASDAACDGKQVSPSVGEGTRQ